MPIQRPRRIFRSGLPSIEIKGIAVVLGLVAIVAAGVSLATLPAHDRAPQATGAEEFAARPAQVAVIDGGTLRLGDRVVLLRGVEPPLRGTECGSVDCGAAATNALATLVREFPVACRVTGTDPLGRAYGVCQANGTELNSAMVAAGWARVDAGPPDLKRTEATARTERRGIWALKATP